MERAHVWVGETQHPRAAELRGLAAESLQLLAAGLPDQAAAFPALFSPPVHASLIGMFELNNLGAPPPLPSPPRRIRHMIVLW